MKIKVFLKISVYFVSITDAKASPMMTILLGTLSVFLPNGYLLYNFAATFIVDFTYEQSKKFLFYHMLAVTIEFCLCIVVIWIGQVEAWPFVTNNIPEQSVLTDVNFKYGSNVALILLGAGSLFLALIHWKKSIAPLYGENEVVHVDAENPNETEENIEMEEK